VHSSWDVERTPTPCSMDEGPTIGAAERAPSNVVRCLLGPDSEPSGGRRCDEFRLSRPSVGPR
jgi:hypothetical protein